MKIEEALYYHLTHFAGLTALINNKVYPMQVPQGQTLPAIVYTKVSSNRLQGEVSGNYGLINPNFQISCYATKYSDAKAISEQVILALDNYKGIMGGTNGIDIQGVFLEEESDNYDDSSKEYSVDIDFKFYYSI